MPQYTPAPYWVQIRYEVSDLIHVQKIACDAVPDQFGISYELIQKNLQSISWTNAVTLYATEFAKVLNTGNTIIDAELWRYLPADTEPVFLDSMPLNAAGVSVAGNFEGAQATYSFKGTQNGGARLVILDTVHNPLTQDTYDGISQVSKDYVDYAISATTWMKTRRGGYFDRFIRRSVSYNDSLTRKRFNVS